MTQPTDHGKSIDLSQKIDFSLQLCDLDLVIKAL